MKHKLGTIIFFLIISHHLFSQSNFKKGYIVSAIGDTTYGEVDVRGDLRLASECTFKTLSFEQTFSPNQIQGFGFVQGRVFQTKVYKDSSRFFEVLVDGTLDLFYLRDNNGDHFFIDKPGHTLTELFYETKIKHIEGVDYRVETREHLDSLLSFMDDAPQMKTKIEKCTPPEYRSLVKLIKEYNTQYCSDKKCLIYARVLPSMSVKAELMLGANVYGAKPSGFSKSPFTAGALFHFWLPRSNEKLFLRTGLVFSNAITNGVIDSTSAVKIPLQIEYVYPKSMFRPKFAYGFNFYLPTFATNVSVMAGCNILINQRITMSVNADFDFSRSKYIGIIPDQYLFGSYTAGVIFSLKNRY